jgi:TonB family protein
VPLDEPPLDPVMKASASTTAAGAVGLEEISVRGRLRVKILVRADGTVGGVEVLVSSGDLVLDEAARRGLLRWRFEPARRDGTPIDAYLLLWITFRE